jgi:hypothetical protein
MTRPAGADENDPDSVVRYFIACGSYLRKDGKVVLGSLSKLYTVFTAGQPEMKVALQGQPVVRASLRTAVKPHDIILNGKKADAIYDDTAKTVTLCLDNR